MPAARGYESVGGASLQPRYEDVAQDGRVHLTALACGLGAVWRAMNATATLGTFDQDIVLPIMRRLIILGERGPFTPHGPIAFEGTWRLARDAAGERLFLNMWAEAHAPRRSIFDPADGERTLVGRMFAEHVLSRPFARTPQERKVTRLSVPGIPEVPEDVHVFEDAEALVAGLPLDTRVERSFAFLHTDSNQHVNSLVYPRMFEEAVTERLPTATLLARAMEMRYRKPFFAGDHATLAFSTTLTGGTATARGSFSPANSPAPSRPSTTLAMILRDGVDERDGLS